MDLIIRIFQIVFDKWVIAIIVAVIAGLIILCLTDPEKKRIIIQWLLLKKKFLPYAIIIVLITSIFLAIETGSSGSKGEDPRFDGIEKDYGDNENEAEDDTSEGAAEQIPIEVFITDTSFSYWGRGSGSLYDDEPIPIWFKSDLDDVGLIFEIDNPGATYANVVHAKLIVDDFKPITMDDLLLFRTESHASRPDEATAFIDVNDINPGRTEYDIDFSKYKFGNTNEEFPLNKGDTFYIDPSSRFCFEIYLQLNKSGIYTYHLEVEYEYYKNMGLMESESRSFIYIDDDIKNYKYDKNKVDMFHYEHIVEYDGKCTKYYIDGRTLRVHDSESVIYSSVIDNFWSLFNTIVVEDGTLEIDMNAFASLSEPGYVLVSTVYLPASLDRLDENLAWLSRQNLKKIFFGGTKEQWDSLTQHSRFEGNTNLDGVEIIYEYGPMPTKEEELQMHQNDESYYELFPTS